MDKPYTERTGGSYIRDPKTGALTRRDETGEPAVPTTPAVPAAPAAPAEPKTDAATARSDRKGK